MSTPKFTFNDVVEIDYDNDKHNKEHDSKLNEFLIENKINEISTKQNNSNDINNDTPNISCIQKNFNFNLKKNLFNNFEYWTRSFHTDFEPTVEDLSASNSKSFELTGSYYSRLFTSSSASLAHNLANTNTKHNNYNLKKNKNLISTTTQLLNSTHLPSDLDFIHISNVVSRVKNWIKKPILSFKQQQEMDNSCTNLNYQVPLSIDFVRKLKRPINVPNCLEYSNAQVFQGSVLEDWLMQSLEEHLNNLNSNSNNNLSGNTTATNSATSFIIEYSVTTNSYQNQNDEYINEDLNNTTESNNIIVKKLTSDSYKAAVQSSNDIFNIINNNNNTKEDLNQTEFVHNLNSSTSDTSQNNLNYKRQEVNFYVQQVLTNLLALGVLEYESGFENAINKTFKKDSNTAKRKAKVAKLILKPKSDYIWGRFVPIDMQKMLHQQQTLRSTSVSQKETYLNTQNEKQDQQYFNNCLKKENEEIIKNLKKQHDEEILNLKNEHFTRIKEFEDKIEILNNEIESNKKLILDLNKELDEFKFLNSNLSSLNQAPPPPPINDLSLNTTFNSVPPAPPPLVEIFNQTNNNLPPPPPPPLFGVSSLPVPPPPPPPPPPLLDLNFQIPIPPPPPSFGLNAFATPPPPPPPPPFIKSQPTQRPILRKKFNPKEEMKTLYWNRIQIFNKSDAIWFDVNEPDIDEDEEFEALFSKVNLNKSKQHNDLYESKSYNSTLKKNKLNNQLNSTSQRIELVKLLDSKRSQAIGILMTSQRLDSNLIKHALINFDNHVISYETLNSIYLNRGQEDELKLILDYLKSGGLEDYLDKPELFLLELSRIPAFDERCFCLVYQNKFYESISSIEFRLNNIITICDEILMSDKIKNILGVILACGNILNASNKTRGDADGFDLAIMPNLKDVKSKDNTTNLIQYIAFYYVNKIDDDTNKLPLPEPSDFNFVAQVNFDELEKELKKVSNELKEVEKRVENVLKISVEIDNELFKTRVDEFLKNALYECKEQEENFVRCKTKFKKLTGSFIMKPKQCDSEVTPEYFFTIWTLFSQDFKDAWKRETQKLVKLRQKQVNEKRNQIKLKKTESKPIEKKSIKAIFNQKRTEESKNKN